MEIRHDTAGMRPFYIVPDQLSASLSDRGVGVYFRNGCDLPEDINGRVLCNLACRLLQRGVSWEKVLQELNTEEGDHMYELFLTYTGMTPDHYRSWCLNRQKK